MRPSQAKSPAENGAGLQPVATDCGGLQNAARKPEGKSGVRAFIGSHMSETVPDILPEIDGIEQLDLPPPAGSKPFTKTYHRDAVDKLIETVTSLPDRSKHFIAPRDGWPKWIYRRGPEPTKPRSKK